MKHLLVFCTIISLYLAACSGGTVSSGTAGGGNGSGATTVSGVAATGAPIAGNIYLKDAAGHELSLSTADGSYSFDVSSLTAPFMLKAEWVVNSTTYTLFSSASGAGTANINPLSNLIVAVASSGTAPASLYATPAQFSSLSANLAGATDTVLNKLQPLLDKYQANVNPISGSFSADHTGLDLLFDNIQVTLTAGGGNVSITDRTSGALILSAVPASMSTAPDAQSWSNQDALIANDPDVAVDSSGRAIVVWSQNISGIYSIIARGPLDNSAATISNSPSGSWAPKIGVDAAGNAVAVWLQSDPGASSSIWTARYVAGSGWQTPVKISTTLNGGANVPQISVDSAGNALAIWHQQDRTINPTNHFDIFSSRYNQATDSWSAAVMLNNNSYSAYNPHISLNANGDGLAVWSQDLGDGSVSNDSNNIWSLRYTAPGGWGGAVTRVNSVAGDVYGVYGQTVVAVDRSGNGMALWVQFGLNSNGSSSYNIWANRFTTAGGWGTAAVISSNVVDNCYGPDISLDANGNAIAVWQQQGNDTSFTAANRFSGGSWGTSVKISDDTAPFVGDTHVRMDGAGNARVVWYQADSILNVSNFFSTVRSNNYDVVTGWGGAVLVSTLTGIDGMSNYLVPRVGINSAGASYTVWGVDSM